MYFKDRKEAGIKLADKLTKYIDKDVDIYGLPRGGVVTAYEIAEKLHVPLNVIITRKIGHPFQPEYAIAALSESGKIVGDTSELQTIDQEWLEHAIHTQLEEIQRRRIIYVKNLMHVPIKGKTAILVDDGIATGLTIEAAIRDIKQRYPKKIVVATPIVQSDVAKRIETEVDAFVALDIPESFLRSIGDYYENFPQVSDNEVIYLLNKAEQSDKPPLFS